MIEVGLPTTGTQKTILVTGVSSGIGRALCLELLQKNYKVIGLARREDKLLEIKKDFGDNFLPFVADVSNASRLREIREKLATINSLPEVVICNAAVFEQDTMPTFNLEKVRENIEINYFGVMNCVETFLPTFLEKKHGHFLVTSSISAFKPSGKGVGYGASKAAIGMSFRGLDVRYKEEGVRFSTIYLGPVFTTMWEGKKSFVVAEPKTIAEKITKVLDKPKSVRYMPFLSTTLSRISLLIPDILYAKLSGIIFK